MSRHDNRKVAGEDFKVSSPFGFEHAGYLVEVNLLYVVLSVGWFCLAHVIVNGLRLCFIVFVGLSSSRVCIAMR